VTERSAAGGQTQETMVDTDVSADHRGSYAEKAWASGEPGAWKSCMPWFGGGSLEKGWCEPVPRWRPILQQRAAEGMYAAALQVLCAWVDGDCQT